jgi:beta-lactamase regulating signal transducer with metallopeptidase domain
MHSLLILVSLLLAFGGCLLCCALLRTVRSPRSRRVVYIAGLFIPTIALVLLSVLMVHFLADVCFLTAPPADVAISQSLTLIGALGIGAAILLNLLRAALLPVHMRRRTWDAPARLQVKAGELAACIGLRNLPAVRVCADALPWAFAAGLVRPQLVVSSGLVALLDDEELNAVLCHEIMHIRRGDLWWTALCGVLRDLTWFFPTTRHLYTQMLAEQEVDCDDHVLGEPRRLALASALVRVWQSGMEVSRAPRGALALFSPQNSRLPHEGIEARVRRLLENPGVTAGSSPYKALLVLGGLLTLFTLVQLVAAGAAMETMGCNLNQLMMR